MLIRQSINNDIFSPLLTAACSGELEQHTERRGVIYSPAWPLNYPPAVNCSWYIQGDRGDMITIRYGLISHGDKGLLCWNETKCEFLSDAAVMRLFVGATERSEEAEVDYTGARSQLEHLSCFRSVPLCLVSIGCFWHRLLYMQVTCSLLMYLSSSTRVRFCPPLIDEEVGNSDILT